MNGEYSRVMLAQKISPPDSELPTRPLNARPTPRPEVVAPAATHLMLVRAPRPTAQFSLGSPRRRPELRLSAAGVDASPRAPELGLISVEGGEHTGGWQWRSSCTLGAKALPRAEHQIRPRWLPSQAFQADWIKRSDPQGEP